MGGSADARAQAEQHMYELGLAAGVKIDYNVQTNWQPVNSQRLMLWAARFGKQEVYMMRWVNDTLSSAALPRIPAPCWM